MSGAAGFQARTQAGQLIGPFNPALLSPAISKAFFEFVLAEHQSTSLSKRDREVIILTVGAAWQAPYELYAHCAVGRHVGLSDDEVHTLAEGGLPDDLSDAEAIAHRVARALTLEHRLDDVLYSEAEKLLGAQGIMDAAILTGVMHRWGFDRALVSETDILDGLLYRMFTQAVPPATTVSP